VTLVLNSRQIIEAIEYLIHTLPPKIEIVAGEEFHIVQMTSPQGLAQKLRIDCSLGVPLEAALKASGLIYSDMMTGFYNTPRYNMEAGGYGYKALLNKRTPMTARQLIHLIPRGAFSGDYMALTEGLRQVWQAGYLSSADGGGSFLVEPSVSVIP
jgi:hypothetical protein